MMFPFLLAAITVSTAFEGGNIGRVEQVAPDHLRCPVKGQADENGRNRQANWYYFRLENLPKQPLTIEFTDLVGEYNFRPGTHAVTRNTRPLFSYGDRTWRHFDDSQVSWDEKQVRLSVRFTPAQPVMWIAHIQPYTQRELDRLLTDAGARVRRETIGKSVHGRALTLLTITDTAVSDSRKKVVWLMARQHAWETGTSWVADGAVRFLISDDPAAAHLRRLVVFKVQPVFDADGVAEGAVRFNANGYDNNRNWDTVDPALMPEIAATKRAIFGWLDAGHPIHLFLAMHNDESSDYVEGPLAAYRLLSNSLADRLRPAVFYDPDSPRDATRVPFDKGRATVDQDLFVERSLPSFLMELMVERHPKLGRPRTAQDYSEFGAGLVRSMAAAAGAAQ